MKSPALTVVPPMTTTVANIMLACLGVYWACLLSVSTGHGGGADTAIKVMLGVAGGFLVLIAQYHARGLSDAARVLSVQRVPAALWRTWLRTWLLIVTRYWVVISACVAVQLAMPASTTFWLAGPALLSLLLCYAALRGLAQAGMAPHAWRHGAELAAFAAFLYVAVLSGFGVALAWFAALPPVLLLAFSLAWPAMAWATWRRHGAGTPVNSCAAPAPKRGGRIAGFMKRYTVLQWQQEMEQEAGEQVMRDAFPNGTPPFGTLRKLTMLMNGEILFYVILLQMLTVHWNSTASPLRAIGLCFVCAMTSAKLAVRDLHWRALLLPGGLQRKRIGTHILLSTLTFQAAAMLIVAIIYLTARIAVGTSPAEALAGVLDAGILPLELIFATSAAVLVRTLRPLALAALAVLVITLGAATLYLGPAAPGWTIGPWYALFLLAGTAACIHLANRRWTPERLLRSTRPARRA